MTSQESKPLYSHRLYARAQTALLKAGITYRAHLKNYDAENGIAGVMNIGRVLTKVIQSMRPLSDEAFHALMPAIGVGALAAAVTQEDEVFAPDWYASSDITATEPPC